MGRTPLTHQIAARMRPRAFSNTPGAMIWDPRNGRFGKRIFMISWLPTSLWTTDDKCASSGCNVNYGKRPWKEVTALGAGRCRRVHDLFISQFIIMRPQRVWIEFSDAATN